MTGWKARTTEKSKRREAGRWAMPVGALQAAQHRDNLKTVTERTRRPGADNEREAHASRKL
ncbi:MAG: hypothetical protein C4547_07295 [Phycisphaerales bacterium]|nr:MAG: hypothetical protein C4547_07295 [Phycisphaerales bacterium]